MVEDVYSRAGKRMKEVIERIRHVLATLRTGRASLAILDGVMVDYYGTPAPLNQVATLTVPDPTLIVAQPWDPSMVPVIEKAILKADLGLNPSNDGKVVRIPIPPLTEERRKEMARKVHQYAEEGRTNVRQVRRDANDEIKALEKDKKISKDEELRAHARIQELTDEHIKLINELAQHKEKEILEF